MCQYEKSINFDTVWPSVFDISNNKMYCAEGNPARKKFIEDINEIGKWESYIKVLSSMQMFQEHRKKISFAKTNWNKDFRYAQDNVFGTCQNKLNKEKKCH